MLSKILVLFYNLILNSIPQSTLYMHVSYVLSDECVNDLLVGSIEFIDPW